mmetsp:Transcript_7510/g.19097  ORF Transcript_7510/g.19097 Transcript_7510/m.19097 type:complete len:212 (+) Transcript_7510:202-837(+)
MTECCVMRESNASQQKELEKLSQICSCRCSLRPPRRGCGGGAGGLGVGPRQGHLHVPNRGGQGGRATVHPLVGRHQSRLRRRPALKPNQHLTPGPGPGPLAHLPERAKMLCHLLPGAGGRPLGQLHRKRGWAEVKLEAPLLCRRTRGAGVRGLPRPPGSGSGGGTSGAFLGEEECLVFGTELGCSGFSLRCRLGDGELLRHSLGQRFLLSL